RLLMVARWCCLVDEIAATVPLGLAGELEPGSSHVDQLRPEDRVPGFTRHAHAIGGDLPVVFRGHARCFHGSDSQNALTVELFPPRIEKSRRANVGLNTEHRDGNGVALARHRSASEAKSLQHDSRVATQADLRLFQGIIGNAAVSQWLSTTDHPTGNTHDIPTGNIMPSRGRP